ncbi:MAG: hypothetical protein SFY95_01675 [Planctomycetota bacterium]|nr:hypothetical protein [Planctomycetota bacterium]
MLMHSLSRGLVRALTLVMLTLASLSLTGCDREPRLSQVTPEETIRTARTLIEQGRAEQVARLIYAENDQMRALYARLGRLLGTAQVLGKEVDRRFPAEVAELRARAEQAAREGKPSNLFSQLASQFGNQGPRAGAAGGTNRQRRSGPPPRAQRDAFDDAITSLLVDPYRFFQESADKVSTTLVDDNTVALLYDNKPVLPPIGLIMKREKNRWYFVLPTNLPGASNFMPRNEQEYKVFASFIQVFDNALKDLTAEVQSGGVQTLEQLSRKAGEKIAIPAIMVFYAYSQMMEERTRSATPNSSPAPGNSPGKGVGGGSTQAPPAASSGA